jgi:hypothetical protein
VSTGIPDLSQKTEFENAHSLWKVTSSPFLTPGRSKREGNFLTNERLGVAFCEQKYCHAWRFHHQIGNGDQQAEGES